MIGGTMTEGRLHIRMRGSPAAGPVTTSHLPDRSNPSNQPDYPFVGEWVEVGMVRGEVGMVWAEVVFLNVCTRLDG